MRLYSLSILFLRFIMHIGKKFAECEETFNSLFEILKEVEEKLRSGAWIYFQFSFWDSKAWQLRITLGQKNFQFSFWDSKVRRWTSRRSRSSRSFNSLFEILFPRSWNYWKFCARTFNSLFEIQEEEGRGQGRGSRLASFNSLFEILIEALAVFILEETDFQFSFWDSHADGLRRRATKMVLSILFLRFHYGQAGGVLHPEML